MPNAREIASMLLLLTTVACGATAEPVSPTVGRITYEVSGGFTGWDRILAVDPQGAVTVEVIRGPSPAPIDRHVAREILDRLHALVADPAFAKLEPAYLPPPGGADLQDYAVTAEVGGRTLKTMTRDGADPPPILRQVLAILATLLQSTG